MVKKEQELPTKDKPKPNQYSLIYGNNFFTTKNKQKGKK